MGLLKRIVSRLNGAGLTKQDLEINRVAAALKRHEAVITGMDRAWWDANGSCCPGCMFGHEYSNACEKALRTRSWLVRLLEKRNHPNDDKRIRALTLDEVESDIRVRYSFRASSFDA